MRQARALVCIAITVLFCVPTAFAEKTWKDRILNSALSSAGSKAGEFAVKFVGGWIYSVSCKPEQQKDEGSKALCGALASLTGKDEEEWKAKIEGQLAEIKTQLDVLARGQTEIKTAIATLQEKMENEFKQVPNSVRITAILTKIDAFWNRFEAEVRNPKQEMNKRDLEKFALDVMRSELHTELGQLNVLLTESVDNAQPTLKYPFYLTRKKISQETPFQAWNAMKEYDFAEKKFVYYRGEMQKGYLVYLWAAEIIQGLCELKGDEACAALPQTARSFADQFVRYTEDQIKAFDAAVNWLLLAYSRPEWDGPNFLLQSYLNEDILMRLNYLTATVLGKGEGAWGQVLSTDGDPWDGAITLQCSGTQRRVEPAFNYTLDVDTIYTGPTVDWWTSRGRNGVYDEVRFSPRWKIYHYKWEDAAQGPCKIFEQLPGSGEKLPWVSKDGEVASVTKDGATYNFGFFHGIQRAGGTWAMASGQDWALPGAPETHESGDATLKGRFDWVISAAHHEGLWADVLSDSRVEQTAFKTLTPTQDKNYRARIYAFNKKNLYFPQGGNVKVNLMNHSWCEKVCRGTSEETGIMDYNIQHSEFEDGRMTAVVAAFLDPTQGLEQNWENRVKNGMYIDGSYGPTRERKTKRVNWRASGNATVNPGTAYHLQYLIYFDLFTHTNRADATSYYFMGKITPAHLFLTK